MISTEQDTRTSPEDDWPIKRQVTLAGAAVNVLLAAGKIAGGLLGQSQALIADGVHSISDLLSDALVLAAANWGSREADRNHPYGHARIETIATTVVGILLLMVAGGFVFDSVSRLLNPDTLLHPGWIALAVAVLSVIAKEVMFQYTRLVARRTGSPLIEANAWHHRSDALSSLVVIGGVAGAMLGLPWLDAVAAIVVAAMLGYVGWEFIRRSVEELVDTGLSEEDLQRLESVIDSVAGVRGHRYLRTRRMGGRIIMDVHLRLDPAIRLSEANRIAVRVQQQLLGEMEAMSDVLVRVEPDDDLGDSPAEALPLRQTVTADLTAAWRDIRELPASPRLTLHYHAGGIDVDVLLAQRPTADSADSLLRRMRISTSHLLYLGEVRLLAQESLSHTRTKGDPRS